MRRLQRHVVIKPLGSSLMLIREYGQSGKPGCYEYCAPARPTPYGKVWKQSAHVAGLRRRYYGELNGLVWVQPYGAL